MKNIFKLLTITFFLSTQTHAQTGTSHNAGTVGRITEISFPKIDSGFVIDDLGQMKKTVDGAINWTAVSSPATLVSSLLFISGKTGFSIGDSLIYKTTNAGATWTQVMIDNQVYITNIFFPDASTGYASSIKYAGDSVRLYKTTNGGNTWIKISTKSAFLSEQALYFLNPSAGFWAANFSIFSTTNGGASFNSVYNDVTQNQLFVNIAFPNIDTGYAVDYASLLRSVNGGLSWTAVNIPGQVTYDTYFTNGKNGFICGGNGFNAGWVSQTSNAGITWTPSYTSGYTFYCLDFPNDSVGYVGGDNGTVLKFAGVATGISVIQNQHVLSIFPNPANGSVTINNTIAGAKITLLNLAGQIIKEEIAQSSSVKMNLENIAAGIYFIEMENAGEKSVQKIVVQ